MSYSVQFNDQTNHFEHHGILGQKWGKMHGPPYPLDPRYSTGKSLRERYKAKKVADKEDKQARKDAKIREKHMAKLRKKKAKIKEVEDKIAENERKRRLAESESELQYAKDAKKRQRDARRRERAEIKAIKDAAESDRIRSEAAKMDAYNRMADTMMKPMNTILSGKYAIANSIVNQYGAYASKEAKKTEERIAKLKASQSKMEKQYDLDIMKQKGLNDVEGYEAQGRLALTKAKGEIAKQNNQFNIDKEKRTWGKGNDAKATTPTTSPKSTASKFKTRPITKNVKSSYSKAYTNTKTAEATYSSKINNDWKNVPYNSIQLSAYSSASLIPKSYAYDIPMKDVTGWDRKSK